MESPKKRGLIKCLNGQDFPIFTKNYKPRFKKFHQISSIRNRKEMTQWHIISMSLKASETEKILKAVGKKR